MPTYEIELTLDEINALLKSVGISLTKVAGKLPRLKPGSRQEAETRAEYRALLDAQTALVEAQSAALGLTE